MSHVTTAPRAHPLLERLEAWAHQGRVRALIVKGAVTVVGPLVVLAGAAMTVLPGPGLVVMALGLGLLAIEYEWARRALHLMGHTLSRARKVAVPRDASPGRRALGVAMIGAVAVGAFVLTTAVTAFVGSLAIL